MRIIYTSSSFTDKGIWGIRLIFLSPVLSAAGYLYLAAQADNLYREPSVMPGLILFFASGIALIAGLLMVLIGREFITEIERKQPQRLVQYGAPSPQTYSQHGTSQPGGYTTVADRMQRDTIKQWGAV